MTDATERSLYGGISDIPLSPKGRSELLRRKSEFRYPDPKGLSFYTSGMKRTEETLEILYGRVPHEILTDLKEMNFGEFEMRGYGELKEEPAYIAWISGNYEENVCPGGESSAAMAERATAGFQKVLESDKKDLLIVTHGGPIAAIMHWLFPAEERNRYEWQPEPGGGWEIVFDGTKPCSCRRIPQKIVEK